MRPKTRSIHSFSVISDTSILGTAFDFTYYYLFLSNQVLRYQYNCSDWLGIVDDGSIWFPRQRFRPHRCPNLRPDVGRFRTYSGRKANRYWILRRRCEDHSGAFTDRAMFRMATDTLGSPSLPRSFHSTRCTCEKPLHRARHSRRSAGSPSARHARSSTPIHQMI